MKTLKERVQETGGIKDALNAVQYHMREARLFQRYDNRRALLGHLEKIAQRATAAADELNKMGLADDPLKRRKP